MSYQAQTTEFIWTTGVEDTFVPQARGSHRPLDEYDLMGHYEHWREDLALSRQLGVSALRWGVPWYRVEPEPGVFDWSWTDQVIPYLVDDLGVTPIIDLVHYGCPFWLHREFANPSYPERVARYAQAFASRYADRVHWYTPHNEPLMTSFMCGQRGLWPPYLRGNAGYVRVMLHAVQGITATVRAIREVDPSSVMVHVEAVSVHRSARPELDELRREDELRGYLSFDLSRGDVVPGHPMYSWLLRHGATVPELARMAGDGIALDIIGLNFYPQWSTRELYVRRSGRLGNRASQPAGDGFEELITAHVERYEVPVMITETSAVGSHDVRSRWLHGSIDTVRTLRGRGLPVIGYTWFPMFTMIDWRYRYGRFTAEECRIDLGLFTLGSGAARWVRTELADEYSALCADGARSLGPISARPRPLAQDAVLPIRRPAR